MRARPAISLGDSIRQTASIARCESVDTATDHIMVRGRGARFSRAGSLEHLTSGAEALCRPKQAPTLCNSTSLHFAVGTTSPYSNCRSPSASSEQALPLPGMTDAFMSVSALARFGAENLEVLGEVVWSEDLADFGFAFKFWPVL